LGAGQELATLEAQVPCRCSPRETRIRSLVAGRIVAIEISNVTGNEATIEIVIELEPDHARWSVKTRFFFRNVQRINAIVVPKRKSVPLEGR
jgi:hypothetical protein